MNPNYIKGLHALGLLENTINMKNVIAIWDEPIKKVQP
jgi:hypothetical protein